MNPPLELFTEIILREDFYEWEDVSNTGSWWKGFIDKKISDKIDKETSDENIKNDLKNLNQKFNAFSNRVRYNKYLQINVWFRVPEEMGLKEDTISAVTKHSTTGGKHDKNNRLERI